MKNDIFDFSPDLIVTYFIYEPNIIKECLSIICDVSKRKRNSIFKNILFSIKCRFFINKKVVTKGRWKRCKMHECSNIIQMIFKKSLSRIFKKIYINQLFYVKLKNQKYITRSYSIRKRHENNLAKVILKSMKFFRNKIFQ